jgi:hypothetical protein
MVSWSFPDVNTKYTAGGAQGQSCPPGSAITRAAVNWYGEQWIRIELAGTHVGDSIRQSMVSEIMENWTRPIHEYRNNPDFST